MAGMSPGAIALSLRGQAVLQHGDVGICLAPFTGTVAAVQFTEAPEGLEAVSFFL